MLLDFPGQCAAAREIGKEAKVLFENRPFNAVVFAGVGGSSIGAQLVNSYLYSSSKAPINVCREYKLPAYVNDSSCVFVLSYSGNSQEAISAYDQARKNNAAVVVISSGGKLKERAASDKVTFIQIPGSLPPRYAIGYLSIIPICILNRLGLAGDSSQEVQEAIEALEGLRNGCLAPSIAVKDNIAKFIAGKLLNRFPVIYSSSLNFQAAAERLRGQINENAKSLAGSNFFPEIGHNEIVGWKNPSRLLKNSSVLMLRDDSMPRQVALAMDTFKEILREEEVPVWEVWSRGRGLLARIFSLVYIGDFISFYLAILYGVDPAPTERIDYLKNKLQQESS